MRQAINGSNVGNFLDEYDQEPLRLRCDKNYAFEIIHDPDEEAGFYRGAKFTAYDVENMLRAGFFTPGTLLRWNAKKSDATMTVMIGPGKYGYLQGFWLPDDETFVPSTALLNGELRADKFATAHIQSLNT